jgi:hypothetical protein
MVPAMPALSHLTTSRQSPSVDSLQIETVVHTVGKSFVWGQLYTLLGQLYTLLGQLYTLLGQLYTLLGQLYTLLGQLYTLLGQLYTLLGQFVQGLATWGQLGQGIFVNTGGDRLVKGYL